jgi:hypothetical protein
MALRSKFYLFILFIWGCANEENPLIMPTSLEQNEEKLLKKYPFIAQHYDQIKWEIYMQSYQAFSNSYGVSDSNCNHSAINSLHNLRNPIECQLVLNDILEDMETAEENYILFFLFVDGEKILCEPLLPCLRLAVIMSPSKPRPVYAESGWRWANDLINYNNYDFFLTRQPLHFKNYCKETTGEAVWACAEKIFLPYIFQNPDSVNTWLRGEALRRTLNQQWQRFPREG